VIYLTAVHTGLRRKELKLMETDDLHLDAEQPFVNVRPSTTKNHKQAVIALHPDVVAELRKLPLVPGKVFANALPKMETFKRDLRRAGIEFIDAKGRRADFHSLRHTLGTNLALAGTAPRVAMEAMRHSDIRLTTKTYTDTGSKPVSADA
jgi:integrase